MVEVEGVHLLVGQPFPVNHLSMRIHYVYSDAKFMWYYVPLGPVYVHSCYSITTTKNMGRSRWLAKRALCLPHVIREHARLKLY